MFKKTLLLLPLVMLLAGCAGYKAKSLKKLNTTPIEKHNDILFAAKTLTPRESVIYLDANVMSKGYKPIHITIDNQSKRTLDLSLNAINMPVVDPTMVAKKFHFTVAGRAIGYGVASLFLWPFIIPAFIDSMKAQEANKELLMDYMNKSLTNTIIKPSSLLNGLIFVDTINYEPYIKVPLVDSITNEIIMCESPL